MAERANMLKNKKKKKKRIKDKFISQQGEQSCSFAIKFLITPQNIYTPQDIKHTGVSTCLTGLEEENGHLSEIEINEVPRFMCHVGAKVSSDYTMPCRVILLVKFLLDVSSNILCR